MKVYVVFEWSGGYEDEWNEFIDIFEKEEDAKKYVDEKNKKHNEEEGVSEKDYWGSPFSYEEREVK